MNFHSGNRYYRVLFWVAISQICWCLFCFKLDLRTISKIEFCLKFRIYKSLASNGHWKIRKHRVFLFKGNDFYNCCKPTRQSFKVCFCPAVTFISVDVDSSLSASVFEGDFPKATEQPSKQPDSQAATEVSGYGRELKQLEALGVGWRWRGCEEGGMEKDLHEGILGGGGWYWGVKWINK